MAKFSAELLKSLINSRLQVPEVKARCLQNGLISLEGVIKNAVENLCELLGTTVERTTVFNRYCHAFILSQDQFYGGINYCNPLCEDNIKQYVQLYVINFSLLVERASNENIIQHLSADIDFRLLEDYVQKRFIAFKAKHQDWDNINRHHLEEELISSIESYYPHLNNELKEVYRLSDLRYEAIYFARLNCHDIEFNTPLTEALCNKFVHEFMSALMNFEHKSSLKIRLA